MLKNLRPCPAYFTYWPFGQFGASSGALCRKAGATSTALPELVACVTPSGHRARLGATETARLAIVSNDKSTLHDNRTPFQASRAACVAPVSA